MTEITGVSCGILLSASHFSLLPRCCKDINLEHGKHDEDIPDSIKISLSIGQLRTRKLLFSGHSSSSLQWVPYAQIPNAQLPMTDCQSRLYRMKKIADSIKVALGFGQLRTRKLLFSGHSSNSLPWVPYAQIPNAQLTKQPLLHEVNHNWFNKVCFGH